MNKNLSNRIFTSIILSAVLLICLFFHKYSWLILLIIASITCFFEFNNLSKKIWKKKSSSIYLSNLISIFYLIFFTFLQLGINQIQIFQKCFTYWDPFSIPFFLLSLRFIFNPFWSGANRKPLKGGSGVSAVLYREYS